MGRTVLVTGVTRFLGSALAGTLAARPDVDTVVGVDAALPDAECRQRMGTAEFVRVDIRSPQIARLIDSSGADTVVHASASASPSHAAAKTLTKEMNVIGTMQLLAGCQRAAHVRNLVVRSTAAVYGGSSRDPAVFTEDTQARAVPNSGPARDAVDIEGYLRGFSRRRPDVRVAVPRFAEIIGPTVRTPLTRYFSLSPFVPVLMGRNSRLQLVHEQDAVDVLQAMTMGDFAGAVNVAGEGTMTVVQAIHQAGRIPLPMAPGTLGLLGRAMRGARIGGYSPEQVMLLANGRTLDTSRLRTDAGITLRYTTEEAFADFVAHIDVPIDASVWEKVENIGRRLIGESAIEPVVASTARPRLVSIDGEKGTAR